MELEIYSKKENFKISPFLHHSEFRCKCEYEDCTFTLLNPRLANAFFIVRKMWNSSLGVSSGFRCQRHNKDSGGVMDSWHKKGCAIDIYPHKGKLLELYELASKFFDLVILYEDKGFIHCQMED